MKLKIIGFITMLAVLFAALPSNPVSAAVADWQQGVSIQPTSANDFASSAFNLSVDKAATAGANHVTLIVPVRQTNINSTDVAVAADTPSDASITAAARYIKSKGMSVGIGIHVNPYDGQWRALVNPVDRATWFANYGTVLNKYATLSQTIGAKQYVLGTELSSMTDPNVDASNTTNWRNLISAVRTRYTGSITYSAQHSSYKSDLMTLGFWPQLDTIGISAYYALSGEASPSVQTIKSAWDGPNNNQVRVISERHGKPVQFTEVGYTSRDFGLRDPGSAFSLGTAYNGTIQANAYQALFEYWNNYSYVQGMSLWDWKSSPTAGGVGDVDYTPQNKPAEQILQKWYGGGATTPAPTPTPSPSPTPAPAPTTPSTFTATAQSTAKSVAGTPTTVSASIASSQPVSGVIVDIEIFDSAGRRLHQQAFENQSLNTSAKTFSAQYTPTTTGELTVKLGVFTSGWQSNLYWNDAAYKFIVNSTNTPAPQPAPAPSPTPSPAPVQPAPVTPPPTAPASRTVSIWWPGADVTVSGVQPFKAVVDGMDVSQYEMSWQVDGGALNKMATETTGTPHKLSYVDLTNWRWNASKQYTITFVAQDLAGNVIGKKSVVITAN